MWLPTTADTPKLIDVLRKLGINDSTSDSASTCTIRSYETRYYFARTSPESDSPLDAISIATTSEVDKEIDPSDGLMPGAQAITEDPGFEGKIHLMNGRKVVLTAGSSGTVSQRMSCSWRDEG
ncbi:hypothetical protein CEK26_003790 [Fusarium fujikuroi]|nr:uncharacterized protein Y057_4019 [Fusarium fujikuroi]QGI71450.1 hypothetical protein CEK27_003779 [Fusarium fujikuroi]QGI88781.1 hypothetical protein CEK25_003737 [Fusarium fujikuroi]QGJ02346.1 hypothetical protein CEK26_003790 [Fusarium fujikuroi]SCO23718.1 uncharacterized protein FFE2_15731 [Fusarium fujikuroi]